MILTPFEAAEWTRRQWLKAGAFGVLGTSLPQLLGTLAQAGNAPQPKAKQVLVILEQGGLSHTDSFDPKPEVVAEHRSPFQQITTSVPGMFFTETLAKTSRFADRLSVVRAFRHLRAGADGHPQGTQYTLSGAHPVSPQLMPDIGSIVSKLVGSDCRDLPPYIMVPGNNEQAAETHTGFLSEGLKVFKTGGRDLSDPKWRVSDLLPRPENAENRLGGRQSLLATMDAGYTSNSSQAPSARGMDRFYDQAFSMLTSSMVTRAFDVQSEPAAVRERYGEGHRGACYLVGRKLIESGVRFVTVDTRWPSAPKGKPGGGNLNWDHHDFIYANETCELPGASGAGAGRYGFGHWMMMGSLDQAFSALLEDLEQRGLLAETLVCFVTEFGRTPRINKHQGRDHWTHAYSMAFAGAGVPGGQVVGQTDKEGGYIISQGYTPEDYAATVYEKLGIDRDKPLFTPANRPVYFGHMGEPISALM